MSERIMKMAPEGIGYRLAQQIIYSRRELQDNCDRVGSVEQYGLLMKWEAEVFRLCEGALKHSDAVIAEYHRMSVEHAMRSPAPWLLARPKDPV